MRLRFLSSFLFALVAALALRASAETPPVDPPASITVRGREVAILRVRILGYLPKDRALAASERIRRALDADGPGTVTLRELPEGLMVELDGRALFVLTSGDANALTGETLETVTAEAAARLRTIVAESREGRDVRRLLVAAAVTAAATLLAWGFFFALGRARRWIRQRLDRDVTERLRAAKLGGAEHLASEPLLVALRFGFRLLFFVLYVALVLAWLDVVLTQFPVTRPVGERLTQILVDALSIVGEGLLASIPDVLVVVAIVLLTRLVARTFTAFFRRIETGAIDVPWLEADIAPPTRRIVVAALWVFALVMAYPYIPGSKSEAFKGITVLVGLMVSLGATGAVGQAASGMMLLYSRTLRAGEWVRIGEHEGRVETVGMFATRLRTGFGVEIVLPNSVVVGMTTVNYSRLGGSNGILVETGVTIGYSEPWRQVEALLLLAAERTEALRREPKPAVFQRALSDFYVEYRLYAYTDDAAGRFRVLAALHGNIQDAFNEFGVQIMSPHYLGDPAQPVVVPKEKWHLPPSPAPGRSREG